MKNARLHEAASTLAHRKGSWMPFTTPGVSAAARTLAKARNSQRTARASAKRSARAGMAKAHKSVSRTGSRSKAGSAKRSRSAR